MHGYTCGIVSVPIQTAHEAFTSSFTAAYVSILALIFMTQSIIITTVDWLHTCNFYKQVWVKYMPKMRESKQFKKDLYIRSYYIILPDEFIFHSMYILSYNTLKMCGFVSLSVFMFVCVCCVCLCMTCVSVCMYVCVSIIMCVSVYFQVIFHLLYVHDANNISFQLGSYLCACTVLVEVFVCAIVSYTIPRPI